jgi:hypothetical protein
LGLDPASIKVKEKTMAELEIEQNMTLQFSSLSSFEGGSDLQALAGASYNGLVNLGNSCYMNSVLQCFFSHPAFRSRYLIPTHHHITTCDNFAPLCRTCQLSKMVLYLYSDYITLNNLRDESPPSDLGAQEVVNGVPITDGVAVEEEQDQLRLRDMVAQLLLVPPLSKAKEAANALNLKRMKRESEGKNPEEGEIVCFSVLFVFSVHF